jgi:hypothetical protein
MTHVIATITGHYKICSNWTVPLLPAVAPYVAQYCNKISYFYGDEELRQVSIEQPPDVWDYVQFGSELQVSRRADDDDKDGIYFSLECSCVWEPEHGLVLVVRDGLAFTKVGPYD